MNGRRLHRWHFQSRSRHRGQNIWNLIRWKIMPGAIATGVIFLAIQNGLLGPLEKLAYIGLFQIRGTTPWNEAIVVIEIDNATLETLGQFPIDRYHYAHLLQTLTPLEPAVVAFDILFIDSSEDDTLLAQAMLQQGRVIIAEAWDVNGAKIDAVPLLKDTAVTTGHVLRDDDADGINRYVRATAGRLPSLGLAAWHVYQFSETVADSLSPSVLRDDKLWINWPGPTSNVQTYSFIDVVEHKIPQNALHNKIVLVGLNVTGQDTLKTPYNWHPPTSGPYFHAAVLNTLIEGNALRPIGHSGLIRFIILCLGGPALSWVLSGWKKGHQFSAGLLLGVCWGLLSLTVFHGQYWIPTVTPVLLIWLTSSFVTATTQWRTYRQLRQSEERYDLAVKGSNDGIWDWNIASNTLYVSPQWQKMANPLEEINPSTWSMADWMQQIHPEDVDHFEAAIARHIDGQTPFLKQEYRLLQPDGSIRWMLTRGIVTRDHKGNAIRIAGSQTDISARKATEAHLIKQAFYDPLTDLPNRTLFLNHLQQAITDAHHSNEWVSVFLIDLDRFQLINNSLGNHWGDRLLIDLAERFGSYLQHNDLMARLGGDEYAILSTRFDRSSAQTFAQNIHESLKSPFILNKREVFVSISMGIVVDSPYSNQTDGNQTDDNQPEHWIRDADTALSNAKALGKSCSKFFHQRMRTTLLNRLDLENELRQVLYQRHCPGLILHYQPIVHLKTRQIRSFEALVRWQHPHHGLIPPGRFIPMAEETGLIVPLGEWVLRTACEQMRKWVSQFPNKSLFTVSVNLASKQCALPDLPQLVQNILEETHLSACYLKLELTESAIMDNASSFIDMLHRLRALGLQLAIDDFGTGYSSLSYLRRFPINNLKIDQSFVQNMENEADSVNIVQTIVDLAHSLGIDVTAEGLEKLEHSTQLQSLQCEYGQGYFFSKPVDADTATQFLEYEKQQVA